mmetsp:Transcript_74939/g.173771  ORF Transcript_74939/g.173771 Transcript_74939/m.173771 type:complete len:593 (+) Transcript_74939:44-1822(+)
MATGATGSPPRGRRSVAGASEPVTTPPKTPAKSPRTVQATSGAAAGCNSSALGALLPYHTCEAVTQAVWAQAKAQALRSMAGSAVAPAPLLPVKRRLELPGDGPDGAVGLSALSSQDPSQPSQSQSQSQSQTSLEGLEQTACADEVQAVLHAALEQLDLLGEVANVKEVLCRVRSMAAAATAYWHEVSTNLAQAATSLARFLTHQRRLFWGRPAWRGVNLGGWLILEPGPSADLFEQHGPANCEWELTAKMRDRLGDKGAEAALRAHRETFITEKDFQSIRALGFNAVRIPFGYWIVSGSSPGEMFVGPGLEYLDRALGWCKACGLQALLDLHGAPGGESGETPCGRRRSDWSWADWRTDESIEVLRTLALRYRGHPAVAGISVCNEPSEKLPAEVLCSFYDQAVRTIREAGMAPNEVAVLLPVYRTERLDEIWRVWNRNFDGFARHTNVAFDLHLYHCFGPWWQRQSLGSHFRMVKRHRKILRRVPVVVGEWSLALPPAARDAGDEGEPQENSALEAFGASQLEAYNQASHGWFFWNWRDSPRQHAGWDARRCFEQRWLTKAQLMEPAAVSTLRAQDSMCSSTVAATAGGG